MKITKDTNFIHKIVKNFIKKYPNRKIKTRFPPEPNGYLHIGHAKSIMINFTLAHLYNGECNLRFDDTNPTKENEKYIKKIKEDIAWLGFSCSKNITYTSNYFQEFYKFAKILIKKNLAYVDLLNKKQIKEYRGTLKNVGIDSPYRTHTIKENIKLFKKMKLGYFLEGEACLRAKINMKSPSIIMRDPVLYRILYTPHHRTKKKWFIYPTYDFSHCISDALEEITHSLCTLEFQENRQLYNWILKKINFFKNLPKQYEFSRLNLEYSILSKRKIKILIKKKIISNWNDPRIYTLSGLKNRGYTPNSIKEFCKKIGVTKQISNIQINLLESCIQKELNLKSFRRMAILDPLKIIIQNFSEKKIIKIKAPNHPTISEMGTREIIFTKEIFIEKKDFSEKEKKNFKGLILGKSVKLRYSYVIYAKKIIKNEKGKILSILCTYEKIKQEKKNKIGIIHWISTKNCKSAEFHLFQPLFLSKNPETLKNFLENINPQSYKIKQGYVEKNITQEKTIIRYQFERIGYFIKDNKNKNSTSILFKRIIKLKNYKK